MYTYFFPSSTEYQQSYKVVAARSCHLGMDAESRNTLSYESAETDRKRRIVPELEMGLQTQGFRYKVRST